MINPKPIIFFSALIFLIIVPTLRGNAQNETNTCLECHLELEDELQAPALKFSKDIHNQEGIFCVDCHGGDATEEDAEAAMSEARGFKPAPSKKQIPQFCGRCHSDPVFMGKYNPSLPTDQLDKYLTSHHGRLNKQGDAKAAQCVSCHGVHNIRSVNDPRSTVYAINVPQTCAHCHANEEYMQQYNISTNQYEGYKNSIHGKALLVRNDTGAPACNDCHGNHAATPPGITSIARVCYQCHLAEGELFNKSPHKKAFDELGEAECSSCHGNHSIRTLTDSQVGVGNESICAACHRENDAGYKAAETMRMAIVELKETYLQAKSLIDEAEKKGVEVSDEQFELLDVRQSLINLRKLVHSFNPDTMKTAAAEAMTAAKNAQKAGLLTVAEVKNRRKGLIVFTLVTIIIIVIVSMKIRQMEKK